MRRMRRMPRASTRPRVPKVKIVVERERGPFHSRLLRLVLPSGTHVNTPAFVPSFSSIASPRWLTIAKALRAGAASKGLVLLSAKDAEEEKIRRLDGYAGVVLDSGGYETRRQRKPWSSRRYAEVVKKFRADVVVGFDADEEDSPPLAAQVTRQVKAFAAVPGAALRVLLLHVDPRAVPPDEAVAVLQSVAGEWDILGLVEKDLGLCLSDRLRGLRLMRDTLDAAALYRPIHIFGVGDPFAMSMYALAGADLFDALSWSTGFVDAETFQLLPVEAHEFSARWRAFAESRGGVTDDPTRRGLVYEWNVLEYARLGALLQKAILQGTSADGVTFLGSRKADFERLRPILSGNETGTVLASLGGGR